MSRRKREGDDVQMIARNEHNEHAPNIRHPGGTKFHGKERSSRNRLEDEDNPFDLFNPVYND